MEPHNPIPTELGTEKISRLLKNYALPAIIAMTASSLYNMVDSIFIGRGCGALAISGLAVTFPMMNLSTAFGTLVGVGGQTMISVLLGQKNHQGANKVLGNIVSLNIIIGFIFAAVALAFIDPILNFFGASENTLPYAKEYMKIILYGNIITHLYFGLNGVLRASGNPKLAMGLTLFTVLFNAILDPIFIFVFDMGIKGAATATVIVQAIALCYVLYFFNHKCRSVRFGKGIVRLDLKVAKDSIAIGLGPFLMNAAACLVSLFINQQLMNYIGDLGVGAYGINNRLSFMFIMICMGLNQGMQPIAGFNYGARLYGRVREVYKQTAFWATLVCIVCFMVCELLPETACSIFTHDKDLLELSAHGLRLTGCAFFIIGFQMVGTNLFQCLGMVKKSIFLSLTRQLLFLIPSLYLLPLSIGADGIWWSFPISDTASAIITALFILDLFRKLKKMKDGDDPSILGGQFGNSKPDKNLILTAVIVGSSVLFASCANSNGKQAEEVPVHLNEYLKNDMSEATGKLRTLDKRVKNYMKKWNLRGVQLAVMRNDSLLWCKGYGIADSCGNINMEAGHIMRVASVSKLLTATGIMKLQEDGLISIKDSVFGPGGILSDSLYSNAIGKRMKDYRKITVEHLLRHQAGFRRDPVFSSNDVRAQMQLTHSPGYEDYVKLVLSKPLRFCPGTSQRYSNFSYMLLSEIISRKSGKNYEDYIKEDVLEKAGCYDMHIGCNYYEERFPNEVRYYVHNGNGKTTKEYNGSGRDVLRCYGGNDITLLSGAGAWVCSAAELARFVASIDGKDEVPDILSKESVDAMVEYFDKDTYSLGWNDSNPDKGWNRTGTLSGTNAVVHYYPDGECWIFISNTSTWKGPRHARYTKALFDRCRKEIGNSFPSKNLFKL